MSLLRDMRAASEKSPRRFEGMDRRWRNFKPFVDAATEGAYVFVLTTDETTIAHFGGNHTRMACALDYLCKQGFSVTYLGSADGSCLTRQLYREVRSIYEKRPQRFEIGWHGTSATATNPVLPVPTPPDQPASEAAPPPYTPLTEATGPSAPPK